MNQFRWPASQQGRALPNNHTQDPTVAAICGIKQIPSVDRLLTVCELATMLGGFILQNKQAPLLLLRRDPKLQHHRVCGSLATFKYSSKAAAAAISST
jgi:hypothetical protein